MILSRALLITLGICVALVGVFFVFHYRAQHSVGTLDTARVFVVEKGEDPLVIARDLENEKMIAHRSFFLYYFWKEKLRGKMIAGDYLVTPGMTVPDIARMMTEGLVRDDSARVTFPEGWTSVKMAERLAANGFSKDDFLSLVQQPPRALTDRFVFTQHWNAGQSLEGYLFPDTYQFRRDASAEEIVATLLANFEKKVFAEIADDIQTQKKSLHDVVTLASIVEGEVRTEEDRKIVSGVFWNRLASGQALQSDATIKYILGTSKIQHSIEETRVTSPYNTYTHVGLPPGPIGNPGLMSIEAVLFPTDTDYNYFLSNLETGETVYARTFEEHKRNKEVNGL